MEFTSSPGKYIVYVEVSQTFASLPDLKKCRAKVEEVISDLNTIYRQCREENSIAQLELNLMQKDTFKMLKKMLLSKENSDSQFKMPRLLKNPQQVELMSQPRAVSPALQAGFPRPGDWRTRREVSSVERTGVESMVIHHS